jgi:hypothetical protein
METMTRPDAAESRGDLVVRDDETGFTALRDAALACRRRGTRLRLVDSGRLPAFELEWLGEAGAEIYTSDLARRSLADIIRMNAASRKGGASTSFFHHGLLAGETAEATIGFEGLREMGRSGVHPAVSNKARPREFDLLIVLAGDAARGRSRLVYYHHGALDPRLDDLGRSGVWIHVAATSLGAAEDAVRIVDVARAAAAAGAGVVLHVDLAVEPSRIEDFLAAGGFAFFHLPPSDYRSPLRPLEERAARRPPNPRSGYLYPEFMR